MGANLKFFIFILHGKRMSFSVLICIGIDKFSDREIPKLSYSQSDCDRIKRASNIFNIAKKAEFILNEDATKLNIVKSLNKFTSKINILYIYISSHGDSVDNIPYIYTYDTKVSNIKCTALSWVEILEVLNKSKAKNIIIVIDACKIKLPRYINKKITVYCPRKDVTFEDTYFKQSLFTKAIIKFISNNSLHDFNHEETIRYQKIRKDLFVLSQRKNAIYVYGDSGLGKSHLLRQIEKNEENTYYVSIPKLDGITYNIALTLISEVLSLRKKNKFYNAKDTDPERYVRYFTNINPQCLIIIDHFDHIDPDNARKLSNFLDEIPAEKIIASRSNYNESKNSYQFPKLTQEDINEFINYNENVNISPARLPNIYSKTNYIELLDYIYNYNLLEFSPNPTSNSSAEKKVYLAIAVSGGFINQEIFSNLFKLDKKIICQLIDKGLIIQHESYYYPHDIIYNEAISETDLIELKRLAQNYWKQEILMDSHSTKALYNYILLLKTFSFHLDFTEIDFYRKIISMLKGRHQTDYLLILYNYFLKSELPSILSISMCESLIEIGRFDEASKLIFLSKSNNIELSSLSVELFWWKGHFQECIDTATLLLNQTDLNKNISLLCSRGIGNFFLGRWSIASIDLLLVINEAPLSATKERYLSYCVLATIKGIRGTDFKSTGNNFIEAITIAKKQGKLSWLALIYGNIGEILWKANLLKQSKEVLKTALNLAYLTDNEPLLLEINRNLLHALFRSHEYADALVQINILEKQLKSDSATYVKMQIINTLITHYVFIKNTKYRDLIAEAITLTKNNDEYYIYTLSNCAIIQLINKKQLDLAYQKMIRALELCESGKNWLAMQQCLNDWDQAIQIYNINYPLSKQVFEKWHQVLQIKLSPYFHHLENLYEFLELH